MKLGNDDQKNIRKIRGIPETEPCQRCGGRGYTMKKQTHPRQGLIEVREQCGCIMASLAIPEIVDGRLSFSLPENIRVEEVAEKLKQLPA